MEITIKRVSECSLEQLTAAWNEGFSDYYVPMKFSVEIFTNRFANDELMPSRSVAALIDGRVVGIILNGIRIVNGRKVAWNGGTCVIPEYRRYGVAKAMMDASLAIYEEESVDVATLEAFKQNERAIALYEQKGYRIVDHLHLLEMKDVINPFTRDSEHSYQVHYGLPIEASRLSFYNNDVPWQSYWSNLRAGGESIIVMDGDAPVGYILCKRLYEAQGKMKDILVYSCHVDPTRSDREAIIQFGLHQLLDTGYPIARVATFNTPASQSWLIQLLEAVGFTKRIEQVYMIREYN